MGGACGGSWVLRWLDDLRVEPGRSGGRCGYSSAMAMRAASRSAQGDIHGTPSVKKGHLSRWSREFDPMRLTVRIRPSFRRAHDVRVVLGAVLKPATSTRPAASTSWALRDCPCEGGTRRTTRSGRSLQDHPLAGGEQRYGAQRATSTMGLRRRMRGPPDELALASDSQGINPAHAGTTRPAGCRRRGRRDHPRACGEHFVQLVTQLAPVGSPPHRRGAPPPPQRPQEREGITPAQAGSTVTPSSFASPIGDHPRTGGEHTC